MSDYGMRTVNWLNYRVASRLVRLCYGYCGGVKSVILKLPDENSNAITTIKSILNAAREEGKLGGKKEKGKK